jgi:hypothetical protein
MSVDHLIDPGRIVGYPDRAQRAPFGRQEAVAQVARFQSEYPEPLADSGSRLDSDSIVDRGPNPLFAAQVSLGRLN